MKTLPNIFYTMPKLANTVMDKKDLKELLLSTGGQILANGVLYEIVTRNMGAGVYKVTLTESVIQDLV